MFSMGELDLSDDLTDPFLLNPEDSYSNKQKQLSSDRVGIAKKPEIKAWSGPFIMATANTRVVRRTEALLALRQESYGADFTYQEHAFHKSWFSAAEITRSDRSICFSSPFTIKKISKTFFTQTWGRAIGERSRKWMV